MGNWLESIELMLETNSDFRKATEIFKSKHKSIDYTSSFSCKDFISVLAEEMRGKIKQEIDESGAFSILIDEYRDVSGHEQLSICFRYVKEGIVTERFYTAYQIDQQDAFTITNLNIIPMLENLNFSAKLVGLGADGASVMKGHEGGVFGLLRQHYNITYVHCHSHRLHLVMNKFIALTPQAKQLLDLYRSLYAVFSPSRNRAVFEQNQLLLHPKEQLKSFSALGETRWGCTFEGVDLLTSRMSAILTALSDISNSDSDVANQALGCYAKLRSGHILMILAFMHRVFSISYGLNMALQEKSLNPNVLSSEINSTIILLQNLSKDEIKTHASELCNAANISIHTENTFRKLRPSIALLADTVLDSLFSTAIPCILSEFKARFNNENLHMYKAYDTFDASKATYLDFYSLEGLRKKYSEDLKINNTLLKSEMERAKIITAQGGVISKSLYPNLMKINNLVLTLPITSATVERSFSAFGRIMTKARNSLSSERAAEFVVLAMNRDKIPEINLDTVLNKWANLKSRVVKI